MSVKNKYQSVLELGEKLNVKNGDVSQQGEILKITGQTATPYEKNLLWDEIKKIGGENPNDIEADITIEDESIYHKHVVAKGESLSAISKLYYGDPMKYNLIFQANKNILKNPDIIHPDQELVIPNI